MQSANSINHENVLPSSKENVCRDDGTTAPSPESRDNGSVPQTNLPSIDRENVDRIHVGAGRLLVVPREDIDVDLDVGEDLDLIAMQAKKQRKPGRREWIALNPASELVTRLLIHKPKADGMDTEYYYVAPNLREPIIAELKVCRVFVYYSFSTKTHALLIIHVTIDNSWYESWQALLQQPEEFFNTQAIRVMSDKPNSCYRVRHKPLPTAVSWPTKPTEVLLGEALGADKFITGSDHPIYRDLIDGEELT